MAGVTFDDSVKTHVMHKWLYAYRESRKNIWTTFYLDQCRFKNRIKETEIKLNPILDSTHRELIYNIRFKQ